MASLNGSQAIHLPQEIVDSIIDHIALDQTKDGASVTASLRTCSLLSKGFSIASRRHLFSKIHMSSSPGSQKRSAGLLAILKRRSGPLIFVKFLTIELGFEEKDLAKTLRTNPSISGLYNAISCLKLRKNPFLGVLELLSRANLQNLTIKTSGGYLDWKVLNKETISAFTLLRSGPSLKSLHIHMVKNLNPSFLIGGGTRDQIEHLEMSSVFFAPLETKTTGGDSSHSSRLPFSIPAPFLTQMKSLKIPSTTLNVPALPSSGSPASSGPVAPPRQLATAPFRMGSLKRLAISYWDVLQTESEMTWKVLLSASQSLEYLEIQFWGIGSIGSQSTTPVPIQLHRLATLRSLKFVTNRIRRRRDIGNEQLIPITRIFRAATSASPLETVMIALSWNTHSLDGARRLVYPGAGWLALDEALASSCFPSLKTVRVELELVLSDRSSSEDEPRLEERAWAEWVKVTHFKEMFPNLSSSDWVRLDVEVGLDFVWPIVYS